MLQSRTAQLSQYSDGIWPGSDSWKGQDILLFSTASRLPHTIVHKIVGIITILKASKCVSVGSCLFATDLVLLPEADWHSTVLQFCRREYSAF